LLSDVVGFSEMTDRLGDREAYRVIQRHHGVVRTELAAHGGEEVELRGDGFYLAFARPVPALRCAIAIQRDFALDARLHPEQPIRVRMGLHTGSVLHDPNVYFGKTVIESARIADQARGGEILVSAVFRRLVEAHTDVPFDAGRDVELRGLQGRQQVFSVTWDSQGRAAAAHDGAEHTPRRASRLALLAQSARA
jgi:class 3 adenylate cyclase